MAAQVLACDSCCSSSSFGSGLAAVAKGGRISCSVSGSSLVNALESVGSAVEEEGRMPF